MPSRHHGPRRPGAGDVASGAHAHGRAAHAGPAPAGAAVAAVGAKGPGTPSAVAAAQQQAHIFRRQRDAAGGRVQERHRRRYALTQPAYRTATATIAFDPGGDARLNPVLSPFSEWKARPVVWPQAVTAPRRTGRPPLFVTFYPLKRFVVGFIRCLLEGIASGVWHMVGR